MKVLSIIKKNIKVTLHLMTKEVVTRFDLQVHHANVVDVLKPKGNL